jgi:hypothetical protein
MRAFCVVSRILFVFDALLQSINGCLRLPQSSILDGNINITWPSDVVLCGKDNEVISGEGFVRVIGTAIKPSALFGVGIKSVLSDHVINRFIAMCIGRFVEFEYPYRSTTMVLNDDGWLTDLSILTDLKKHCSAEMISLIEHLSELT